MSYDLAYWGFPCNEYSGLQREGTPESLEESLALFERALTLFRVNLPHVFILENIINFQALTPRFFVADTCNLVHEPNR